jgi:hypothetical protein
MPALFSSPFFNLEDDVMTIDIFGIAGNGMANEETNMDFHYICSNWYNNYVVVMARYC